MTTAEPSAEEVLEKKIGPALRRIAEFEGVLTTSYHENNKTHYSRIIENIREEIKPWLALQAVLAMPKNHKYAPDDIEGALIAQGFNSALSVVREAIEGEMK